MEPIKLSSLTLRVPTRRLSTTNKMSSMADALSVINNLLRSVSFDWKASSGYKAPDGGISDFGLIAEEVNQYLPQLVQHDEQGNIIGFNYQGLIPFAIRGIQQQQAQIQALQASQNLVNGGTINGSLTVTGSANIGGNLTVSGSVSITNNLTVTGTLQNSRHYCWRSHNKQGKRAGNHHRRRLGYSWQHHSGPSCHR